MGTSPRGIDGERLAAWFATEVGASSPLRFEELGPSTLRAEDGAGRAWVLRLGRHDVARGHRVVSALAGSDVPVPAPAGWCADGSIAGAPFSVTEFVPGLVLRTAADAEKLLDLDGRRAAGEGLVDALAALHAVDAEAAELGDLGPGGGHLADQLARWRRRLESGEDAAGRCLLLVHDLADFLGPRLPPDPPVPSIVHGDYRLDSVVVGADGRVAAVLGWEGATLGDPLFDLGQLLAYWTDPGEKNHALGVSPTAVAGFPRRREVALRYAERTGRDLDRLHVYVGFAYWKLACLLEEVYGRERAGGRTEATYLDGLSHQVLALAEAARETLGGP